MVNKVEYKKNVHHCETGLLYRVRQKSSHLKFFAVFSATVWHFSLKFYVLMFWNVPRLTVKYNVILLRMTKLEIFLKRMFIVHGSDDVDSIVFSIFAKFFLFLCFSVNTITHEPLYLAWWNFERT